MRFASRGSQPIPNCHPIRKLAFKRSADIDRHTPRAAASAAAASPSSSSSSSPPPKIRRMQVGVSNLTSANRSVGQRIKEASLKGGDASSSQQLNNNVCGNNAATLAGSSTAMATSAASSSLTNSGGRHRKKVGSLFGESEQSNQFKHVSPRALTECQRNTIRVIGQYLRTLGMNDTVDSLVEESGCRIESTLSVRLKEYVLNGLWNRALEIVEKFRPSITERQYLTVRVLLLEEKFKSLIASDEILAALRLLQIEYPKDDQFKERYEYLATLLMIEPSTHSGNAVNGDAQETPINEANDKANAVLPPSLMLPPGRLQELLNQSYTYQVGKCDLHLPSTEETIDERAILKDHQCGNHDFPTKNTQVLGDHFAEVWCLEFSPCGQYLASGAKSNCVLLWKVAESSRTIRVHRRLQIPVEISGVSSLSWSSDSTYLAVASTEENATGVFIFNIAKNFFVREYRQSQNDSFSVVSFFGDNSHRLACGDQRGHFHFYDVDRPEDSLRQFEGFRIRCVYSLKDGKTVLASDTHNRIRSYDFETMNETNVIQEASQIMYFTVDQSEQYCLVTTKTEGIRLWCLKTRSLIRSFFGSTHSEFVITSAFGGNFVASGSEDEQVVIWNTKKSEPVRYLRGHSGTVNTVVWNPKITGMLASGSDDGTIRIWT
ncbi:WD repeat-containing protein 26 [Ditylenchus destructor]|nr:WD repeat-containing protein 26 [Ditylenchus destructor]